MGYFATFLKYHLTLILLFSWGLQWEGAGGCGSWEMIDEGWLSRLKILLLGFVERYI